MKQLSDALEVATSGYSGWRGPPESDRSKDNSRLIGKIIHFHRANRGIYGSPRVHRDVLASGDPTSVNRVARHMKKQGIQSKMARKFVITTDSKNTMAPAPD